MFIGKKLGIYRSMLILWVFSTCFAFSQDRSDSPLPSGKVGIYLYGETHGVKKILERELELWRDYYDHRGMRHLFVELPFYTAEFLNIWMKAGDNEILDSVFDDWAGTANHHSDVKAFYVKIKEKCPETMFHGTDVGHQYDTTGERFLAYMRDLGKEDSRLYRDAVEAMDQGKEYYHPVKDPVYRENMMAENFIREFDRIGGESIMGIYGSAHTDLEGLDYNTRTVPCMANQLNRRYGGRISSESLTYLVKEIDVLGMELILVGGKEYEASYFGRQNLEGFRDFVYRDFWRLENAYDDLADSPESGDVLPYSNYPMNIDTGQAFIVDYRKTDGSDMRFYYLADGTVWKGRPSTVGILPE